MAMVARAQCDICRTEDDVQTVTVVYGRRTPWEADVCAAHFKELFGVLERKGRRATRSNVRPQHRMAKLDEHAFSL